MKKNLVASLAAAMVLGVAGTSFAAANPFVDVPAKHWAYDSVLKVSQAGVIDGMGNSNFAGDKVLTRYEIAQIVAKAMARSDKMDAAQKAELQKLENEFADELKGLNVRVTKLEADKQNLKFTGKVRARLENTKKGSADADNQMINYLDLWGTAQVSDNWKAVFEVESKKVVDSASNKTTEADGKYNTTRLYGIGTIGSSTVSIGKFARFSNQGVVFDASLNGAAVAFGTQKVKANIYYGKLDPADIDSVDTYSAGDVSYEISKTITAKAAYHSLKPYTGDTNNILEIGGSYKLNSNIVIAGDYAKSDKDTNNKAAVIAISYKGADLKTVNSYGTTLSYMDLGVNAALDTTFDMGKGYKGYTAEFYYVPAKNVKLGALYYDAEAKAAGVADKKFYRGQVEFFF